jgi:hypothetical protein
MQSDARTAFATNDVERIDRTPDLLADAFVEALSVRDIDAPVCIACLGKILNRPAGEVVDEVMSLYASFDIRLNDAGTCRICERHTVVVS